MGNVVFNVAKGKVNEYHDRVNSSDPTNAVLVVVLLKSAGLESDAALVDHNDLAAVLAAANDECDFTNYARKILSDSDIGPAVPDDTNERNESDIPDQTWTAAGGATNNTIGKLLICYDPDSTGGADSAIIPLTAHDFSATTDGTDLTAQIAAAGYFRAA